MQSNRSRSTDGLLTRDQAAAYLGLSPQTLAKWHYRGRNNLPVVQCGRAIRYRRADLDHWIDQHTTVSSEGAG